MLHPCPLKHSVWSPSRFTWGFCGEILGGWFEAGGVRGPFVLTWELLPCEPREEEACQAALGAFAPWPRGHGEQEPLAPGVLPTALDQLCERRHGGRAGTGRSRLGLTLLHCHVLSPLPRQACSPGASQPPGGGAQRRRPQFGC